jgi:hypothetical protein
VDKLPSSIKHLTFGYEFDKPLDNLPPSIKNIKLQDVECINFITKIPFDCVISDSYGSVLLQN